MAKSFSLSHMYVCSHTHILRSTNTLSKCGPMGLTKKKKRKKTSSCGYEGGLEKEKAVLGGTKVLWWSQPVCLAGRKGLPLFIKPRQIQLACSQPTNPINLLSCESTQQLLPISHFSQTLIRSAQDIQWGSLQLRLWCYSCRRGFKNHSVCPACSQFLSFIFFNFVSIFSTIYLSPVLSCFFFPFRKKRYSFSVTFFSCLILRHVRQQTN